LNNNLIVEINENAFKGLKQLEYINLDHNAIESIHQGAFTNCLELKYVFARYNQDSVRNYGWFLRVLSVFVHLNPMIAYGKTEK
jgi:Leucine-rich repeat (LRR) protein